MDVFGKAGRIFIRGLKRTVMGGATAYVLVSAFTGFKAVDYQSGYKAVADFAFAATLAAIGLLCVYVQGMNKKTRRCKQ